MCAWVSPLSNSVFKSFSASRQAASNSVKSDNGEAKSRSQNSMFVSNRDKALLKSRETYMQCLKLQ